MNNANQPHDQYGESAIQEYLSAQDAPPTAELTLADIDPFEHEQFEQEMRDSLLERDNKWMARLIHFGIRKPR
jgi:hypothetical protein